MLPPLDAPHHLRSTEWGLFREGVVRSADPSKEHSFVDVGLDMDACVKKAVKPGVRVTLRMGAEAKIEMVDVDGKEAYQAELATPAGESPASDFIEC